MSRSSNTHMSFDDDLLTIAEVAGILRIDDTTVRRWVKLGTIPAIILPHQGERQGYRIRRSTIDDILQNPINAGVQDGAR